MSDVPRIRIADPDVGAAEEEAVTAVLRSGRLTQGPVVEDLERGFAGLARTRHAVAVSSGTAALHLALLAHGVGPGDEVIVPAFSFIATANCALFVGARPVFAEIDRATYTLDPASVAAAVTPRTRAVIAVHLYGHPADTNALAAIAEEHGLVMVEDAAQAAGAALDGRPVGAIGTGCFSLYATKNVVAAEGGVVTTDDGDLADRLRLLRSHGQPRKYRSEILGYNFRLSDVHAAIGVAQLGKLDQAVRARAANAAELTKRLEGVELPVVRDGADHAWHQFTVRVPDGDRDALAERLDREGIETGVYYPLPIYAQPVYRDLGYRDSLPETERASQEVLSLPVHPKLSAEDLDRIVEAVNGR